MHDDVTTLKQHFKQDKSLTIEDIKESFSNWLNKPVHKLDNGTFAQIHSGYVIEAMNVCKHCHKKHIKGCCASYSRAQRTKRATVINIAWLNNISA